MSYQIKWVQPDQKLLICCICGFYRESKHSVIKHLQTHLSDLPYLDRHDEINQQIAALKEAKIKKFLCHDCNQYFTSSMILSNHRDRTCEALNETTKIERAAQQIVNWATDPEDLKKAILVLNKKLKELTPEGDPEINKITEKINLADTSQVRVFTIKPLRALGQENLTMLEDTELAVSLIKETVQQLEFSILKNTFVKIFELIHCNQDYQENWNIHVGWRKRTYPINVFTGTKWEDFKTGEILCDLCCKQILSILKGLANQLLKNKLIQQITFDRLKTCLTFLKDKSNRNIFFQQTGDLFYDKLYESRKMIKQVYRPKN